MAKLATRVSSSAIEPDWDETIRLAQGPYAEKPSVIIAPKAAENAQEPTAVERKHGIRLANRLDFDSDDDFFSKKVSETQNTKRKRIQDESDDIENFSSGSDSSPNLTRKSFKCRRRWSLEEEEALIKAVKRHGKGNWSQMLQDIRFKILLDNGRTNENLKDKFRNLSKN